MKRLALLLSSCLGIGYVKGGGTLVSILTCAVWYYAGRGHDAVTLMPALLTALILVVGIWSAGEMEVKWGKDSYRVVIDEVAGMCLSLLFIPVKWPYILIGLILFRFFDMIKPLYIRRLEDLRGGWGVMMDDMLAGLYANLILQALVFLKLW
ncbi:MAG: phosphatidylglycerophosphatase A [Bacteroidota bacterium]|nr:phosphatidylglycerophosphatase A [Bacteroidota bacterium]MDP4217612.1 phosphatidylglycerophosphatase A [Bacteroidota bacterium]MDP4246944.1 phosphatidylglycerophosphatase A [Bacteroidota bacterium]MDP4252804.1 phosphatidylglycerophosphatase A [Bacteroidota bacterium]MDP4257711.1 phosphatidylglycerophosphatase A [Bacteroidota bacterium]